jgi:hypothetical protein
MIEAFTARSGAPSLRIDGKALHSPYDPAREAERFVREILGSQAPSTVVVLGEGLGHVASAVSRLYPQARTLRITYAEEVARAAIDGPGPGWHPGMASSLADFLRLQLGELDIEGLRVVEWPPSARLFPYIARAANEAVRQVVQELNGSIVTSVAAGRIWIRNSIANYLAIDTPLSGRPCAPDRPIVIAASGPTLEQAADCIADVRGHVDIWALPSSCLCLLKAGLEPDLVIMTDPGFYSMYHMHFFPLGCPIAMPLSAARGTWSLPRAGNRPTGPFLLAQPVLFEQALLEASGMSAKIIPPHGTVAATAIDLALSSTRAPVVVAGLDMCLLDMLSHARPNAFDKLLHLRASRLEPHHSLSFHRAMAQHAEKVPGMPGVRVSPSLRTYAGWFDESREGTSERTYRLLPAAVPLRGLRPLTPNDLRGLLKGASSSMSGPQLKLPEAYPTYKARKAIVQRLLKAWAADMTRAQTSLRHPDSLSPLERFPDALSLAYVISPRLLVETRKKERLGDKEGARRVGVDMLETCISFLHRLAKKTLDDA